MLNSLQYFDGTLICYYSMKSQLNCQAYFCASLPNCKFELFHNAHCSSTTFPPLTHLVACYPRTAGL